MKSRSSFPRTWRIWGFCLLWLLALGAIWLSACAPPTSGPTGPIDFQSLPLGTIYHVNDTFTDSGVTITVLPFEWSNGSWTHDGFAEVTDKGLAGGSGHEIIINNVNLGFDISGPLQGLSVSFGEYGGNLNIDINGDFRNFGNFADINTTTIGGVNISVVNGHGNDAGSLELTGSMKKFDFQGQQFIFVIGGQELVIDDVVSFP